MYRGTVKEYLTRLLVWSENEKSPIDAVADISTDKYELDDVLELKRIHNLIEYKLECSPSRFLKLVTESSDIKYNESEMQGLLFLNKVYNSRFDRLNSHEFIIMSSLARTIESNLEKKRDQRFKETIFSYTTDREMDVVLGNNGAVFYHAYLQLFLVLCKSIYKNL